ncbi:MAG: hypothetical protein R3281_13925 [Balneolaceae bacterium]|nr:hypothetical protein [Balneolaceae bacterium]
MTSPNSYIHPHVERVNDIYGNLPSQFGGFRTIRDHLLALAAKMQHRISTREIVVFYEVSNYHPEYLG